MYPTKILLATDGSKESAPAVLTAVELAAGSGSELHVVHAVSTVARPPYPHLTTKERGEIVLERLRLAALALLDEKVREIQEMGGVVAGSYYREGEPIAEVLRLAEGLGVGLIVTGDRTLGKRRRPLVRSFAMGLFRRADCPVLLVRADTGPGRIAPCWQLLPLVACLQSVLETAPPI